MSYYCRDVRAFHDKFDLVTPSSFTLLEPDLKDFRVKFFREELDELRGGIAAGDVGECVDALIDLVYITCGAALLHGIDEGKFVDMLVEARCVYVVNEWTNPRISVPKGHLLQVADCIKICIEEYDKAHENWGAGSDVKNALATIYYDCLSGYKHLGFTTAEWNELWDDVQKCNLAKERVLNVEDSKRGSKYDVRKPQGWQPPRTKELVAKFIAARSPKV